MILGHIISSLEIAFIIFITYKVLAYYRTKKVNSSTGCLACGSEALLPSKDNKVVCEDCGYEGSLEETKHQFSRADIDAFIRR